MDHPLGAFDTAIRPWRTATLVACAIAAVELVLLVAAGGALLARHGSAAPARQHRTAAAAKTAKTAKHDVLRVPALANRHLVARLARGRVGVLVLNGNGRSGAASGAAKTARRLGYPIRGVANAQRMDYGRSIVMYRPGFEAEGRRLGRDLGIRLVGPLDGLRTSQLHGAKAVVIVGR